MHEINTFITIVNRKKKIQCEIRHNLTMKSATTRNSQQKVEFYRFS
jgi:hypothetical protein